MAKEERGFHIVKADLASQDVRDLITLHQRSALAANTVCEGHALSPDDYDRPDLTLFAVRDGTSNLLGIGGLQVLNAERGELKTMHTQATARGQGVGEVLLAHILDQAKSQSLKTVYLETGTAPFFAAATRLYHRLGFTDCPPFAAYTANPDSRFMRRELT